MNRGSYPKTILKLTIIRDNIIETIITLPVRCDEITLEKHINDFMNRLSPTSTTEVEK